MQNGYVVSSQIYTIRYTHRSLSEGMSLFFPAPRRNRLYSFYSLSFNLSKSGERHSDGHAAVYPNLHSLAKRRLLQMFFPTIPLSLQPTASPGPFLETSPLSSQLSRASCGWATVHSFRPRCWLWLCPDSCCHRQCCRGRLMDALAWAA